MALSCARGFKSGYINTGNNTKKETCVVKHQPQKTKLDTAATPKSWPHQHNLADDEEEERHQAKRTTTATRGGKDPSQNSSKSTHDSRLASKPITNTSRRHTATVAHG
jgi:hypothetical protein